jgi:formamidopyrimidine-DNA glycosylase
MPELPEVETIVRCLRSRLTGQRIEAIRVLFPPLIRNGGLSALRRFERTRLIGLRRRGKMILIDCQNRFSLLFHLKMTGQLLLCPKTAPLDKHTRLVISFRGAARELRFQDIRKFGFVRCLKTAEAGEAPELKNLGPEPFGLDLQSFRKLLEGRHGRLKSRLINQTFLAGIGNIYADEILFEAQLHPAADISCLRPEQIRRLWESIQFILDKAIAARGTSIRDFRDGDGLEGSFQAHLRVYGREGQPCWRCGRKIVRLRLAGRSSHVCPRCQQLIPAKRASKART